MGRDNCFDLIRLIAAIMVVVSHHAGMMEYSISHPADWLSMDSFYVYIFISLSGFLVTKSLINSKNFLDYIAKRIKRIFPALIFCCFVVTYFLVPFWETKPFEFILSGDTLKGFLNMSILHGLSISNAENIYGIMTYANAPLWTLSYEFMLYLILGAFMGYSKTWKGPGIILLLSLMILIMPNHMTKDINTYGVQLYILAKFGIGFSIGSILFLTKHIWDNRSTKLSICALCLLILFSLSGQTSDMNVIGRVAVAVLTIIIGVSFKDKILRGRADISYGLYIWAWPIQSIVIHQVNISFWPNLILTMAICVVVAIFSRKYIEEPFLSGRFKIKKFQ
ncbi:acyltransferase family protein [Xenorhabdus bovienii]|uniref:Putative O-acetyl transferase n=1 Tax=Xenorhabdus bovienii str. feltiae Moldova TaxID=1398200 RepID=A0A077NSQ1_XENBV|nr:acyltransferase [Xenorhabdus bovienii]CDH01533.1 putative O-acetyl transferase [Xenorhabdus bovienii str. feltiae Moldova]